MTSEQIKEILDKHQKCLNHEVGGERANFSDVDLSNTNFSGANLSGANFRGAYLCDAYLKGANLEGTIFTPGWKLTKIEEDENDTRRN